MINDMNGSSEFIKGYTKIIVCAYLYKQSDYLYNIVKNILDDGEGLIKITNPSTLMVMKQLEEEGLVSSYIEISKYNQARKYYQLTKNGEDFYLNNKEYYLNSLSILKNMIGGNENE